MILLCFTGDFFRSRFSLVTCLGLLFNANFVPDIGLFRVEVHVCSCLGCSRAQIATRDDLEAAWIPE